MKRNLEEKYAFYRFAKDDLNEAFESVKAIKRYKKDIAISALVKIAVISYSRPFKTCRGRDNQCYKLQNDVIPVQYKTLHQKIITYRDQIFAHTDIHVRKPAVQKWTIDNKEGFSITYRGFSPKDFLHETDKMKLLIEKVLSSLQLYANEIKKEMS